MVSKALLGNDIVDLEDDDCTYIPYRERFIRRVFHQSEQRLIAENKESTLTLWRLWATKEAAYKALNQRIPGLVFAHNRFVVAADLKTVHYDNMKLHVRIETHQDYVHVLCSDVDIFHSEKLYVLVERMADPGLAKLTPKQSGQLLRRSLARRLAEYLQTDSVTIERPEYAGRPGPPRLVIAGNISSYPISLSHHGRFNAAAVYFGGNA